MRILSFVPHLGGGGAEMHLARLLNALGDFERALVVARGGGSYEKLVNKDVTITAACPAVIHSSTLSVLGSIPTLVRQIRRWKPDVVFGVMEHGNFALIAAARLSGVKTQVVAGVQIPTSIAYKTGFQGRLIRMVLPHFYGRADHIVCLSTGVRKDLTERMPGIMGKSSVIGNIGYAPEDEPNGEAATSQVPNDKLRLVACGRLTEQKDFLSLIRAFAIVRKKVSATLRILGEGELRPILEAEIERLHLGDVVALPGFSSNVMNEFRNSDIFVLSSLYEGFGNVIVEAMAAGLPVVVTDCPYGPAEILENGKWGILVETGNCQALADGILRLAESEEARKTLRRAGLERARAFSPRMIADQYRSLFQRLCN